MAQDEQVLVVKQSVLEQTGMFQGLAYDVQPRLKQLFAPGTPRFMPRPKAENDPSFKQLIPYVLLSHQGRILSYVRGKRAGETRLVGNRSIGIGGHINPVDDMSLFGDFYETYLNAVKREVEEEIHVNTAYQDRIIALINDDSNAVGSVHLGVVHLWTLDSDNIEKREQMITQMSFMTLDELAAVRDTMETWSQLCLEGLIASGELSR
jgi:predicted NUDIX family phosphoesterase